MIAHAMNNGRARSYQELIAEEANFGGTMAVRSSERGIISDYRNRTAPQRVRWWWDHPETYRIVRGKEIGRIIELASARPGQVADLGCNTGWLALELARRGMNVLAVDISNECIELASRYWQEVTQREAIPGTVAHQVGDLNRIDLGSQRFEAVTVVDTLHHLPECGTLVTRVHAALKTGGVFIVYDHIGQDRVARQVGNLCIAVLGWVNRLYIAFRLAFSFRWVAIWERLTKREPQENSSSRESHKSPFEGVAQQEMIDAVRKVFPNVRLATTCAFTTGVAQFIHVQTDWPYRLKRMVIRATRALDNILVCLGILRGEFVFMYARRRAESP